jgi:phage terminase large subunit GpA-like protein
MTTSSDTMMEIDARARLEIVRCIEAWKTSSIIELPSEWAGENRYIPEGLSNLPGKINHEIAPHLVEIQDCFHPDSGIRCVTVMKSTQSLVTTTIENPIGWAIKNKLHNILYVISSRNIARVRSSSAIDVLIDYSGLAEYVKPISTRMKRKVADNTYYKEFAGGRKLMMTSYNSIADAKSLSWDLIILDELEEAPFELRGQGDPEKIFEGRGVTARHLKIAKISTPTNTRGRINVNFLEGDQRYFHCQCPLCGERQQLVVMMAGRDFGLTAAAERVGKVEQIVPESVHYICEHCHGEIREYQKQSMLSGGLWVPTADPTNIAYRSYHISNLMSPIMFYTWPAVMQRLMDADWGNNIPRFKNFQIDILGLPWESRSEKRNWEELMARAEAYELATMPPGALIPVAGCDVQKTWIEAVVVAYGIDMENWIIDHQKFYCDSNETTRELTSQAWVKLRQFITTKKYKFRQYEIPIALSAIDSGYNPKNQPGEGNEASHEHTVYEFVARTPRTIACRGNPNLKDCVLKQERVQREGPLKIRYDVAVNELKDELATKLDLPGGSPGAIHFTRGLGEEFFKGFLSEAFTEIEPGKWAWKKLYERNEPLDCYNQARAAAEYMNLPSWTPQVWNEYETRLTK